METSIQIKPSIKGTLMSMKIGENTSFPIERRGSVRTTISYMKEMSNIAFETEKKDGAIIVTRKK